MALKVVHYIAVFLTVLVVGVFWGTWFSLSRSIASISPAAFLEIGRTMIGNLAVPMRVLIPAELLAMVVLMILLYRKNERSALYLTAGSFVLAVVALLMTLVVNVPIDNEIKGWTVAAMPAGWYRLRDTWETYHLLRTFVSLGSFALLLLGVFQEHRR